jgi:hypothetical protein
MNIRALLLELIGFYRSSRRGRRAEIYVPLSLALHGEIRQNQNTDFWPSFDLAFSWKTNVT